MPIYDVLKKIEFKETKEVKLPGQTVELTFARARWLIEQNAIKPFGAPLPVRATQQAALTSPPRKRTGCCGR